MALAVAVRFDFIDEKGKTSFTKIRVPTGFSISQYSEFVVGMGQFISNISACRITGASLTFNIDLSGLSLKGLPASIADTAQKGYFSFLSTATGFYKRLRIPTFNEALISAGSDNIDTIDANVAAFLGAMNNGIVVTGGTIEPTTERGHNLVSVNDAREVFRKKR